MSEACRQRSEVKSNLRISTDSSLLFSRNSVELLGSCFECHGEAAARSTLSEGQSASKDTVEKQSIVRS